MERFTGILGILAVLTAAFLFSTHRRFIRLRVLLWGLGLQFTFAFLVLKTPLARGFQTIGNGVNHLLAYAAEGSKFVFGDKLGAPSDQFGTIFAFQVLPIIIFIASLFAVLYYLGVMQVFVRAMAILMQRVMGTSGAESMNVAASIFMGQTEAPLTIRPFLSEMTESELFTVMSSGMAHVSGAVMAAYVLIANVEIRHLLTAVIMTAPATLMLAKMLVPETGKPLTMGGVKIEVERPGVNIIDAASRGAADGLQLALNVGGMLIAFLGLIALLNGILGVVHATRAFGWLPGTLQGILGRIFAPVAWLLGVKWRDCASVGNLLGTRLILNEFVAYADLGKIGKALDPRSFTIATYALCGFANLSSVAIQVGGIGALAPSRKSDLARLGLKAVACGTMANFMSACIAGMLV
ncbi:MAG TPA: nucleoside transporter C-terminal domain-containing protein [Bryobacteraceae bacterium]|nr:nucleoside transporter C-terminal domain-containing protein [Bryobacteraceae bacterium]